MSSELLTNPTAETAAHPVSNTPVPQSGQLFQANFLCNDYFVLAKELAAYESAHSLSSVTPSVSLNETGSKPEATLSQVRALFLDAETIDLMPVGRRCFKVHTDKGTYLSKIVQDGSFEGKVDALLRRNGLAEILPPIVEKYTETRVITWKYVDGKIDESAIFKNTRDENTALLLRVIDTLVQIHSTQPGALRDAPEIIDPEYFENLSVHQYDRLPGQECHDFIRSYQTLGPLIRNLRNRPCSVMIHGDFKLDNLLQTGDGDIRVIDWEAAGFGSPARDMGNLIGCFISSWLSDAVINHTGSFQEILPKGPWSAWECFSFISSLIDHFCACHLSTNGIAIERHDIWRYSGIFLMQRAWVQSCISGRQTLASKMAANLGAKLIHRPQDYDQYFQPGAPIQ